METTPNLEFNKKREFTPTEDAIARFFAENEIDKLNFSTPEEAKAHVDMINGKYGNISFVAEDRGGFSIKFRRSHLGDGFEEYKPEENGDNGNVDLEKAA